MQLFKKALEIQSVDIIEKHDGSGKIAFFWN